MAWQQTKRRGGGGGGLAAVMFVKVMRGVADKKERR